MPPTEEVMATGFVTLCLCECLVRGIVLIYRDQKAIQGVTSHCGGHDRGLPWFALSRTLASYGASTVARVSGRGRVAEV